MRTLLYNRCIVWARLIKRQGARTRVGQPGFDPSARGVESFLHSFVSRLALDSTQTSGAKTLTFFQFRAANIQSHPNTMRADRRLSLAAQPCLLAGQRAIRLTLLPNTHSVILVYFPSRWSRASTYICKADTLAFTDCDYCQMLVL